MPAYRFFLDDTFVTNTIYEIASTERSHIKVMRLRPGDELELVNGRGELAKGELQDRGRVKLLSITSQKQNRRVIICQAIPKINRIDLIVEKGTELGMTHLWLFPGKKSDKKQVDQSRLKRLETISISSMKQCGRLHLPKIEQKPPLKEWTSLPCTSYFGTLNERATIFKPSNNDICFFIGPEAGFSPDEEEQLQKLTATGVKLGPHILRTDTASLVALSLIQTQEALN